MKFIKPGDFDLGENFHKYLQALVLINCADYLAKGQQASTIHQPLLRKFLVTVFPVFEIEGGYETYRGIICFLRNHLVL